MANAPDEEKAYFLLNALATSDGFQPNYAQLATAMGINNAHNAQRKFKTIVEAGKKFKLESGKGENKCVRVAKLSDGGNGDASTPPSTPATSTKTPKSRKRSKKEEQDDEAEGSPTKKTTKKASTNKSEEKIEEGIEDNEDDKSKSEDE